MPNDPIRQTTAAERLRAVIARHPELAFLAPLADAACKETERLRASLRRIEAKAVSMRVEAHDALEDVHG